MMGKIIKSNYDITRDETEKRFLKYDQEKMINKFSLKHDENYLYINFIGHEYRIDRFTGKIEWSEDAFATAVHADFNEALTIFDVLCESAEDCRLTGDYTTVNQLPGVARTSGLGDNFWDKDAKFFEHQLDKLSEACEKLGGEKGTVGDVAYTIPLFDFLPIILQYWDSDDEFDAVIKIMWDKNALKYMKYETTYYAVGHLMTRLKELSGIEK